MASLRGYQTFLWDLVFKVFGRDNIFSTDWLNHGANQTLLEELISITNSGNLEFLQQHAQIPGFGFFKKFPTAYIREKSSKLFLPAFSQTSPTITERALVTANNETILSAVTLPPNQIFQLQSNPAASKIIYLDFTGHTTTGTGWNDAVMGSSFYSPPYDINNDPTTYSESELANIFYIWQRVSKDFIPFDVNVTTMEPPADWLIKSNSMDANYGIRAVITSYGPESSYAGGIAEIGSFIFDIDSPVFVYGRSTLAASSTISHEVGHSLGLAHDGLTSGKIYYNGHGTGETSWAPIMGGGNNINVSSWDNGIYYNTNNGGIYGNYGAGADDIQVILGQNDISPISDAVGNSATSASPLAIDNGLVAQFGVIGSQADTDWFYFQLADTGSVTLNFDTYWYRAFIDDDGVWGGSSTTFIGKMKDIYSATPYAEGGSNLDLAVELYDSLGNIIDVSNDSGLSTSMNLSGLPAGKYYLKLDGVGFGDPTSSTPTGYTDYASMGNYWISGTIASAVNPPSPAPLVFTPGIDTITGNPVADTFTLNQFTDSLWSSIPDKIVNLQANMDSIDTPSPRTNPIQPKPLGAIRSMDIPGVSAILSNKDFKRNTAASFTYNDAGYTRTFLAVNDGYNGFNSLNDSIIEVTGFSGNLSNLSIF